MPVRMMATPTRRACAFVSDRLVSENRMNPLSLHRCLCVVRRTLTAVSALAPIAAVPLVAQEYRAIPALHIPATNANYPAPIGSVSSVVQLSNGSIIIADNTNAQLHFFSAGGRYVRSVGREGTQPGEFKAVRWVGECSRDSVFAYDYMQNRISVFGADGKLGRTFASPAAQTVFVRCGLDGTMAYVSAGNYVGTVSRGAVQTYSASGALLYRSSELMLDEGRPLGKSMKIAIADSNLVFGIGDSAFITWQSTKGGARKKLTAGIPGRTPTEINRNASLEYWANYLRGGPGDIEQMRQQIRKLPQVTTLATYSDLFLDGVTKAAWVQTSVLGDAATILQRVGLDGTSQGRVSLPPNLFIQQIRGDVLVAKATNVVTGAEAVVTYRLAAPGR